MYGHTFCTAEPAVSSVSLRSLIANTCVAINFILREVRSSRPSEINHYGKLTICFHVFFLVIFSHFITNTPFFSRVRRR